MFVVCCSRMDSMNKHHPMSLNSLGWNIRYLDSRTVKLVGTKIFMPGGPLHMLLMHSLQSICTVPCIIKLLIIDCYYFLLKCD